MQPIISLCTHYCVPTVQRAAPIVREIAFAAIATGSALATYSVGIPFGVCIPLLFGTTFAVVHMAHMEIYAVVATIAGRNWHAGVADQLARPITITAFITAAIFTGFAVVMAGSGVSLCYAGVKSRSFLLFIDGMRNFTVSVGFALSFSWGMRRWTFEKIHPFVSRVFRSPVRPVEHLRSPTEDVSLGNRFNIHDWTHPQLTPPLILDRFTIAMTLEGEERPQGENIWKLMEMFPKVLTLEAVWELLTTPQRNEFLMPKLEDKQYLNVLTLINSKLIENYKHLPTETEKEKKAFIGEIHQDCLSAYKIYTFLSTLPQRSEDGGLYTLLRPLNNLRKWMEKFCLKLDAFKAEKIKELLPQEDTEQSALYALCETGIRTKFELSDITQALGLRQGCTDERAISKALQNRGLFSRTDLLAKNILGPPGFDNAPELVRDRCVAFIKGKQFDLPRPISEIPRPLPPPPIPLSPPPAPLTETSRKIGIFVNALFTHMLVLMTAGLQIYYSPIFVPLGIAWGLVNANALRWPSDFSFWYQIAPDRFPSFVERCRQIALHILKAQVVKFDLGPAVNVTISTFEGLEIGKEVQLKLKNLCSTTIRYLERRFPAPPTEEATPVAGQV